ncbi:hypothetical protein Tco_0529069 [Tanacetum coccineum]
MDSGCSECRLTLAQNTSFSSWFWTIFLMAYQKNLIQQVEDSESLPCILNVIPNPRSLISYIPIHLLLVNTRSSLTKLWLLDSLAYVSKYLQFKACFPFCLHYRMPILMWYIFSLVIEYEEVRWFCSCRKEVLMDLHLIANLSTDIHYFSFEMLSERQPDDGCIVDKRMPREYLPGSKQRWTLFWNQLPLYCYVLAIVEDVLTGVRHDDE